MKVSVSVSLDLGLLERIDARRSGSRSEWIARELERALGGTADQPNGPSASRASSRAPKVAEAEAYVLPKIARRS